MERKILIERFKNTKPLNYIAESGTNQQGKHYIGRLEGPAADLVNPTRNGRKYSLQLWRNVENSDDFKEGMETLTIFGEADHPEERLETSIKEIAVCLREFEIRESEGIVWCSFDILDTPNGRIVKELLDYGSKLGVSSRGSGEEAINPQTGENEIDPETYLFICFDVVIMPAVKQARPEVVESANLTKINESVKREINNANTVQELTSIKTMIEKAMPGNDSLIESINNKLGNLESGENISSKLANDLDESIKKIHRLEKVNKKLSERLSAQNMRVKELRNLVTEMKSNSRNMRNCMKDSHTKIESLNESISMNESRLHRSRNLYTRLKETSNSKIEKLENRIARLETSNARLVENNNSLKNKNSEQLSNLKSQLRESRIVENDKYNNLLKENDLLQNEIDKTDKELNNSILRESKLNEKYNNLVKSNNSLKAENKKILSEYLKVKSSQSGFSSEVVLQKLSSNYTISDVDNVISEMVDQKLRMNRLPISIEGVGVQMNESREYDSEDIQTISILKSLQKIE